MSKSIVVITGSPPGTGSTAALAEAFTRGTEQAGHAVAAFLPAAQIRITPF